MPFAAPVQGHNEIYEVCGNSKFIKLIYLCRIGAALHACVCVHGGAGTATEGV